MRLVFKESGHGVSLGTIFEHEGKKRTVTYIEQPRHAGSSGKVTIRTEGTDYDKTCYTSVWGMEFIEREDRATQFKLNPAQVDHLHSSLLLTNDPITSELVDFLDNNVISSITLSIVTR